MRFARRQSSSLVARRSSPGLARRVAETMTRESSAPSRAFWTGWVPCGEDALAARSPASIDAW